MTAPWAATPPEVNYLLLARGAGESTTVAAAAAWQAQSLESVMYAESSQLNTAVTGASWVGAGGAASALSATVMNGTLGALSAWSQATVPIAEAAAVAFRAAVLAMIPDVACTENRMEQVKDVAINPMVWGALTPDIVRLDGTYFGPYWTENASQGILLTSTLMASIPLLEIAPPVGPLSASPAAPAAAAAQVAQATAEGAVGDGMRESVNAGMQTTNQMGPASAVGSAQSMMEPLMSAAGMPMQLGQSAASPLQSLTSPLQSMLGMFTSGGAPGALGAESAAFSPGGAESLAGAAARAGGGGGPVGGSMTSPLSSYPLSSYTRPTGSFGSEGGSASYAKPGAGGTGVASAPTASGMGTPMGMLNSGAAGKGSGRGGEAKPMRLRATVNSAIT